MEHMNKHRMTIIQRPSYPVQRHFIYLQSVVYHINPVLTLLLLPQRLAFQYLLICSVSTVLFGSNCSYWRIDQVESWLRNEKYV